jgi:ketosteroid isomerase-like protein
MSEHFPGENLEIATQMFIWWNLGDREVVEESLAPDLEIHTPLSSTQGGPYRGIDGFRQWVGDIDEQFEDWYSRPEEWIEADGDRVLVLGELHMRGRESGVELDQPMGWLLSFRDGRLFRYEVFLDHEEARRAAGTT